MITYSSFTIRIFRVKSTGLIKILINCSQFPVCNLFRDKRLIIGPRSKNAGLKFKNSNRTEVAFFSKDQNINIVRNPLCAIVLKVYDNDEDCLYYYRVCSD